MSADKKKPTRDEAVTEMWRRLAIVWARRAQAQVGMTSTLPAT